MTTPGTGNDGLRVLLVEDNVDTRSSLQDVLEIDGHAVTCAGTLGGALERLAEESFDVLLLDRRLPDGLVDSALPELRQRAPEAAVLIATGHADFDSTLTALRHGVYDYLIKPIEPAMICVKLEQLQQLRAAQRRAADSERLAAVGEMLSALSHESRNALHGIQVALAVMQATHSADPRFREPLQHMQACTDYLTRLFGDLRSYVAPVVLQTEPTDSGELIDRVWRDLQPVRGDRDAALRIQIDADDPWCQADPFRLQQVFRNLLENALSVCTDPLRIDVLVTETTLGRRPALEIRLRDNGPGLAAEIRERLFEPFFTTRREGSGLGLAITRRLIDAHEGSIVAGEGGPGAEFLIRLPRRLAGSDWAGSAQPGSAQPGSAQPGRQVAL